MAGKNPRVQVTVDRELAEVLATVKPRPASKSRLIRDMALRGAQAVQEERQQAKEFLLGVARGEIDCDFDAIREVYEMRREHRTSLNC